MDRITSKENAVIKQICALNSSSKQRKKIGAFAAEGFRLCSELLNENIKVELLCVSEDYPEKYTDTVCGLEKLAKRAVEIPASLFEKISDTKSPQGVICICASDVINTFEMNKNGRYLALENISDPINLGTIVRTAEALGINGIIMSKGCCDLLSPKVVRGSMGAIFRLPFIFVDSMADYVLQLNENGFQTFASVVQRDAKKITDVSFNNGCVVIIGNEGNGLEKETVYNCSDRITVPMKGRAESLNAAAAASIIMWELMRK